MKQRPQYCPFCGSAVGSFFGRFDTADAVWCERCEEWFNATRVEVGNEPDPRDVADE